MRLETKFYKYLAVNHLRAREEQERAEEEAKLKQKREREENKLKKLKEAERIRNEREARKKS